MRIAITGTTGQIGRAALDMALAQGHTVVGMDQRQPETPDERPNQTFLQVDMTDYAAVEQALAGCEALIHMAAIPSPGGHPDYVVHNNNVVGSYNALSAAVKHGIKKVCQASSVNATGLSYSRWPRLDYFPLDEQHPTYNEEPYSLSKWICELQAASIARRYEDMTIASLRFSWVTPVVPPVEQPVSRDLAKNLWGYTSLEAAASACLLSIAADYKGHEVFYITAPHTLTEVSSVELARQFFPETELRPSLTGNRSFFDCSKAGRLLNWYHPD